VRRAEQAPGYTVQLWMLFGIAAGFVGFVLTRVPARHWFLALVGPLAFAAAMNESKRAGPAKSVDKEPLFVTFAAAAAFFVPVLLFAFPFTGETFAAIALGVLCVEGFWALHRYPAEPEARLERGESLMADVGEGVFVGMLIAAGFSAFAAVIMVVVSLAEGTRAFVMLAWIAGSYFAGGITAGVIFGFLRPVTPFPLGLMLVGILGGMVIYGSVGIAIPYVDPESADMTLREQLMTALALGVLAGPPAALSFKYA
jgi:hypothetical protein